MLVAAASIASAVPASTQTALAVEPVELSNDFVSEDLVESIIESPIDIPFDAERAWYFETAADVRRRYGKVMATLLEYGADVNAYDETGLTALHYMGIGAGSIEEVLWLLEQGVDVNVVDNQGRTPLHWAASYGRIEIVETLLANGADVNARDIYGRTPLLNAASSAP